MKSRLEMWTPVATCFAVSCAIVGAGAMMIGAVAFGMQSPRNSGASAAQSPYAAEPPRVALQIDPYEWHDADTAVDAVMRLPYGVLLEEDRGIRAIGYDAWEIGHRAGAGVTDAERARGRAALAELRELSRGRTLWAEPEKRGSRDSFGRPLARFWLRDDTGWIDVAAWARENGHTRR